MTETWGRDSESPTVGYEWTCPYCGAGRVNASSGESGRENAVAALRTHITASDGNGHGPRHELSPADARGLAEHVVRVGPHCGSGATE